VTEAVERTNLSEQELFDRLVELTTKQLELTADIKQIKADNKFHKKENPKGIPAADIALVSKAATLEAQNVFEEFAAKNAEVTAKFKELTQYDD
jgi:hypothetical protein